MTERAIERILAAISLLILIMTIYPLMKIAEYNYPSCDDFSYGIQTYKVFQETGSVWLTLKAAFSVVKEFYVSWQGSFAAIFLMALQPAVWNVEAYGLTTFITIGALVISQLMLMQFVVVDLCKGSRSCAVFIGCLMISMQIFWIQSPVEAFFWFNGSVYYTLFYSLMLILLILVMRGIRCEKKGILSRILSVLLAFFIGGGNYPGALLTIEILTCLGIWAFIKRRRKLLTILPCYMSLLAAFVINVAAPGNAVRQSNNQKMPALKSILVSIREGINLIEKWSVLPVLLIFMLLTPFLWKCIRNADFKFRYPVLMTLLSIGLFSSQLTPTLYAQSFTGPGRFVAVMAGSFLVSIKYYGYESTATVQAWNSVKSGEAIQYMLEQQERYALLQNEELKQVGLSEFSVKPTVLYFDDIEEDPANWKNAAMADFFEKEKVWLIPSIR